MLKKQNGFTIIEVLLVVAILCSVAAIGLMVLNRNKPEATTTLPAEKPPATVKLLRDERSGDEEIKELRSNNSIYNDSYISFTYPGSWTGNGKAGEWHYFSSADYQQAEPSTTVSTDNPTLKGYKLNYRTTDYTSYNNSNESLGDTIWNPEDAYNDMLNTIKSSKDNFGGDYEETFIDGKPAIVHNTAPFQILWEATIFDSSYQYDFTLEAPDIFTPAVKTLFGDVLASVKIKLP